MSRYGLFGGSAPSRNYLSSLYDDPFLRPDPASENALLSALIDPQSSGGFLSGVAPANPLSNNFLATVVPPRPKPSALVEALARLANPPQVIVSDWGVDYTFDVFPIYYRPIRKKSVYIFGQDRHRMFYAGIAEDTSERLSGHERMAEAIGMGANEVWIHTPGIDRLFDYKEAERRLIERHCFPLNKQHNRLASGREAKHG